MLPYLAKPEPSQHSEPHFFCSSSLTAQIHTVDQRVNAYCLILAELENQWYIPAILGPWNNELIG